MEKLSPQESEKLSPQESEKLSPQESEKLSPHADPPSILTSLLEDLGGVVKKWNPGGAELGKKRTCDDGFGEGDAQFEIFGRIWGAEERCFCLAPA